MSGDYTSASACHARVCSPPFSLRIRRCNGCRLRRRLAGVARFPRQSAIATWLPAVPRTRFACSDRWSRSGSGSSQLIRVRLHSLSRALESSFCGRVLPFTLAPLACGQPSSSKPFGPTPATACCVFRGPPMYLRHRHWALPEPIVPRLRGRDPPMPGSWYASLLLCAPVALPRWRALQPAGLRCLDAMPWMQGIPSPCALTQCQYPQILSTARGGSSSANVRDLFASPRLLSPTPRYVPGTPVPAPWSFAKHAHVELHASLHHADGAIGAPDPVTTSPQRRFTLPGMPYS